VQLVGGVVTAIISLVVLQPQLALTPSRGRPGLSAAKFTPSAAPAVRKRGKIRQKSRAG
jgi:hypothetical protein